MSSLSHDLWGATDVVLYDCESSEQGLALAKAIHEHDPKREFTGSRHSGRLSRLLDRCESPIEVRLAIHLYADVIDNSSCDLDNQVPAVGGKYRLDFTLCNERSQSDPMFDPAAPVRICIEADGHDFHERTKEQAGRDKSRDRALAAEGWTVLRFTGSEIWKNPAGCVSEIMGLVEKLGGTF
jgi:hypothetical protein